MNNITHALLRHGRATTEEKYAHLNSIYEVIYIASEDHTRKNGVEDLLWCLDQISHNEEQATDDLLEFAELISDAIGEDKDRMIAWLLLRRGDIVRQIEKGIEKGMQWKY